MCIRDSHKRYRYRVVGGEFTNPFKRNYTGHYKYPVDVERMQTAAQDFVGEHDFTSFVASGSQATSNVRRIDEVTAVSYTHLSMANKISIRFTKPLRKF